MREDEIRELYEALPELPVRLVGGLSDGKVVQVDKAGPEVQQLKVEVPRRRSALFAPGELRVEIHEYAYVRLDDATHEWIYAFMGKQP